MALKKTQSIAQQAIAAIKKAEIVVNSIEKLPDLFQALKDEVNTVKADMNLGLEQYEVEISEKKADLDEKYLEQVVAWETKINDKRAEYTTTEDVINRQKEKLKYNHAKAVEREDLDTATKIATTKGLALFDKNIVKQHENDLASLKSELETKTKIAVSSAVKNAKEEQSKVISELETTIKLQANDLSNSKDTVVSLTKEVDYLKAQLEAARQDTIKALAAARADINLVQDAGKK